jgi:tryptophanyl-tRNA synthetase
MAMCVAPEAQNPVTLRAGGILSRMGYRDNIEHEVWPSGGTFWPETRGATAGPPLESGPGSRSPRSIYGLRVPQQQEDEAMARVLSGIQPTGEVHIGNYIGAIRHWVADQHVNESFFCLVDLHAITLPHDPETLRAKTVDVAAILLAAGIDPAVATLFVQSHVHEHAELAWVLNCYTTFGELRRMTQFKEKSAKAERESFVSVGLFDYPVLQAADILIYHADLVPVGEDQRQHVELTRNVATRFNQRFGETFTLPQPSIPPVGAKIMDLQNPLAKMSKSADSPQGTLLVNDPPDVIAKKIKTAVTDSGRDVIAREDKPAISNLLTIYSVADGRSVPELEAAYHGKGYGELKADLSEVLVTFLQPFQQRYKDLMTDPGEVERQLEVGARKAQGVAAKTLAAVYERVGFLGRRG